MKKPKIVRDFERAVEKIFVGIAIPCDVSTFDGGTMRGEKILRFNRKALRNIGKRKADKVSKRFKGGDDGMIDPVGKPGSRERIEALAIRYSAIVADGSEVSPFSEG